MDGYFTSHDQTFTLCKWWTNNIRAGTNLKDVYYSFTSLREKFFTDRAQSHELLKYYL